MASYLYPFERKLVVVSVISDLVTDYRVHKVSQTLKENGYRVLLIGSRNKRSLDLNRRDYQLFRIKTLFGKTAFFYFEFNIRLFFALLRSGGDIFLGNDLDVMPATMLAAKFKKKPIVYDSHEFFLGMAGMDQKPIRRGIWQVLENLVFSRLKYMYTVSDSIRNLYRKHYHKKLYVVRNLPFKDPVFPDLTPEEKKWIELIDRKIPTDKHLILFQGAGINESRGAEELIYSMLFLDPAEYHLLIIGGGDVMAKLEQIMEENHLHQRVVLIPKVPFAVLSHFTRRAHLGVSIDKPLVVNHKYSLPNKLFEYLHAGVPVLASRLIEQERIINHYNVGCFIDDYHPQHIAQKIKQIFENPEQLALWKSNTLAVREELNWENESKIVMDIFKQVERDSVNY